VSLDWFVLALSCCLSDSGQFTDRVFILCSTPYFSSAWLSWWSLQGSIWTSLEWYLSRQNSIHDT